MLPNAKAVDCSLNNPETLRGRNLEQVYQLLSRNSVFVEGDSRCLHHLPPE